MGPYWTPLLDLAVKETCPELLQWSRARRARHYREMSRRARLSLQRALACHLCPEPENLAWIDGGQDLDDWCSPLSEPDRDRWCQALLPLRGFGEDYVWPKYTLSRERDGQDEELLLSEVNTLLELYEVQKSSRLRFIRREGETHGAESDDELDVAPQLFSWWVQLFTNGRIHNVLLEQAAGYLSNSLADQSAALIDELVPFRYKTIDELRDLRRDTSKSVHPWDLAAGPEAALLKALHTRVDDRALQRYAGFLEYFEPAALGKVAFLASGPREGRSPPELHLVFSDPTALDVRVKSLIRGCKSRASHRFTSEILMRLYAEERDQEQFIREQWCELRKG